MKWTWDMTEPATDADVEEVKRRLSEYTAPSFDAVMVASLIRLIECQKQEIKDVNDTLRLMIIEQNEAIEEATVERWRQQ